jgi:hypothetical protein
MQPHNQTSALLPLLPLLIMSVFISISSFLLAKEKGRNVLKWTVLGSIPILNFICVWFFVGATNLRIERKLDDILAELKKTSLTPPN